jgi:hypothetical protein
MTPAALERELTWLYELTLPLGVESVLVTRAESLDALLPASARRPAEQLLVRCADDQAEIALYLADEVLQRLARDDPRVALHDGNLQPFLHALEGVSHFVCLAWNAQFDREVSALELELQAEVDKFLLCHALLERQGAADPRALIARLFDAVRYDPALAESERWRYLTASEYARRYWLRLAPRLGVPREREPLVRELRRFYRLSASGKLLHIGGG